MSPISKTPDQISAQILATLSTTIPGLSCEIGTPERKIVDACSEAISEAYIDQYLVGSLLDIDTKSGLELEQYVGIFGFGRLQGRAATGVVRMTANIPSPSDQSYPLGTQFYTTPGLAGASQQIYFSSTQAVVLVAGNLSCDIPVRCTVVGTAGNVAPDSITYFGTLIGGSTVTNLTAMTGGVDIETDQELRQRFKDTLMRNVAGTSDFYEALCQQNNHVNRVVVFGPTTLYSTQIAVPSTTLVLPINQDVKYAFNGMETVFANLGQENETFYSPVNDYTYVGGASPTLTRITTGALVVANIVDLELQYTTRSSRNDPANSITNKVDIFVDGVDPFSITERTVVSSAALTATTSAVLWTGNFKRIGSPGSPTAANRFMRLGSVPIVSFPPTITVGAVTYTQGTHYFLLQGTTLLRGSHQEISGIEWAASGPANGTQLTLTYVYNRVPELLNAIVATAKQITTDAMVHQADFAYVQPAMMVEYSRSFSVATVNSSIIAALQGFLAALPFGSQIKLNTLCMVVQQVIGVVDAKITTSTDNPTNYGVQIFANSADVTPSVVETTDFKLNDNQLALYQGVLLTRVATP